MTETTCLPARPATAAWRILPFILVTALSAALLFAVQPMVGKALLPPFGGSAAVWTATMLFFQAALLAGSALLHLTTSRFGAGPATLIHLGLAATGVLTLAEVPRAVGTGLGPAVDVLATLALGYGPAMLAMGANAAILQLWYTRAIGRPPWWLYAVSNAGSLAGLLAYPLLVEGAFDLSVQGALWRAGYLATGIGLAVCAALALSRPAAPAAPGRPAGRATARQVLAWTGLALLPTSVLLGATQHISTAIMPLPLLWVVPLALYLVSWIVAFAVPAVAARGGALLLLFTLCLLAAGAGLPGVEMAVPVAAVALHAAAVLAAGLVCHGRLALARPEPSGLTRFYLCLSLGGVLGGLLNALVAPAVFALPAEYPLALAGVAALLGGAGGPRWLAALPALLLGGLLLASTLGGLDGLPVLARAGAVAGAAALLVLLSAPLPRPALALTAGLAIGAAQLLPPGTDQRLVAAGRDFYGSVSVIDAPDRRLMMHGRTVHGFQWHDPTRALTATGYYGASGGGGRLIAALRARHGEAPLRGVTVGLGAGVMACGTGPGLQMDFIEISPAVLAAARRHFSFLSGCGEPAVELADGRMALARRAPGSLDLIVIDAYGGGAVPVHLLTREAIALYLDRLTPGGAIAVHVSSHHIDLGPVVAAATEALGVPTLRILARADDQASIWLAITRDAGLRAALVAEGGWSVVPPGPRDWRDARWDLLSVMRWRSVF